MSARNCGCDPEAHHVCDWHSNVTVEAPAPVALVLCSNCGFQESAHLFTSPGGVRVCPTSTYQPVKLETI